MKLSSTDVKTFKCSILAKNKASYDKVAMWSVRVKDEKYLLSELDEELQQMQKDIKVYIVTNK